MRKEEDKFEIPTNVDDLKEYFYELNFEDGVNEDGEHIIKRKSRLKEEPKQFQAAVLIIKFLLANKDKAFTKADLIRYTSKSTSTGDEADYGELSNDAYKHAITLLSQALIITNVHVGKTTTEWGFNPNLNIHNPPSDNSRRKKAHAVVGSLYSELSYTNYEVATDLLETQIYKTFLPNFFGYEFKENENIPVCDPEKIPYWKEEMELVKQSGYSSLEEFNEIMYQRTSDERYLPQSAKDMFVF